MRCEKCEASLQIPKLTLLPLSPSLSKLESVNIVKTIFAAEPITRDPAHLSDLETVFGNIVSIALGLAGIALFIMLIIGGFKYITSAGDPKRTEAASKTLTAAIGGLVLIALAYLILRFIGEFTGVDVENFRIGDVY